MLKKLSLGPSKEPPPHLNLTSCTSTSPSGGGVGAGAGGGGGGGGGHDDGTLSEVAVISHAGVPPPNTSPYCPSASTNGPHRVVSMSKSNCNNKKQSKSHTSAPPPPPPASAPTSTSSSTPPAATNTTDSASCKTMQQKISSNVTSSALSRRRAPSATSTPTTSSAVTPSGHAPSMSKSRSPMATTPSSFHPIQMEPSEGESNHPTDSEVTMADGGGDGHRSEPQDDLRHPLIETISSKVTGSGSSGVATSSTIRSAKDTTSGKGSTTMILSKGDHSKSGVVVTKDEQVSKKAREQRRKEIKKELEKNWEKETGGDKSGCNWSFVFDPSGRLIYYWSMIVSLAFIYNSWVIMYRFAFDEISEVTVAMWLTLDGICDFIYILDVAVHFRIGFLEEGVLQTDGSKLRQHYMNSTLFYVDCLCLLPLDFLYLSIGFNSILRCFRLVKIYRFWAFLDRTERHTNYPNVFRTASLLHYILCLFHWNACMYHLLSKRGRGGDGVSTGSGPSTGVEWFAGSRVDECIDVDCDYLHAFYWSTLALTTIGDLPRPKTKAEYVFLIIELLMGLFLLATVLGHVANIVTNVSAARKEFQAKLDSVKTYMRMRRVPEHLKIKVIKWFDYLWMTQKSSDEEKSVGFLPAKLKAEIAIHVHLDTLKRVEIFQNTEAGFLCALVLRLKPVLFSPTDYVCRKGEIGKEMFIVNRGKLQVVTDNGKTVLATLRAGSYFGEISILNMGTTGNRRTASVRSVGYSDLFCLSKTDMWDVLKDYPAARVRLEAIAVKRLEKYRKEPLKKISLGRSRSTPGLVESKTNLNQITSGDSDTGRVIGGTPHPRMPHSLVQTPSIAPVNSPYPPQYPSSPQPQGMDGHHPQSGSQYPYPAPSITSTTKQQGHHQYPSSTPPSPPETSPPSMGSGHQHHHHPPHQSHLFPPQSGSINGVPSFLPFITPATPTFGRSPHITPSHSGYFFPPSGSSGAPGTHLTLGATHSCTTSSTNLHTSQSQPSQPHHQQQPPQHQHQHHHSQHQAPPSLHNAQPHPSSLHPYPSQPHSWYERRTSSPQPLNGSGEFISIQPPHSPSPSSGHLMPIQSMSPAHSSPHLLPGPVSGSGLGPGSGSGSGSRTPLPGEQSQEALISEIKRLRDRLQSVQLENENISNKLAQKQWDVENRLAEIEQQLCGSNDHRHQVTLSSMLVTGEPGVSPSPGASADGGPSARRDSIDSSTSPSCDDSERNKESII